MWGIELAVRDSALALAGALEGLLAALSEGAGGRDSLGERIEAAMQKLEALLLHDEWPQLPFADSLQRISATLGACRQAIGQEQASRWPSLQRELHEAYEAVASALRADDASVRAARPNNYARSTFHVLSALLCLVLTLYVCTPAQLPWAAGAFAGTFWSLEITRRMWPRWNDLLLRLLGKIAHPSERHRVNSSTWYVTALTLLGLTQSPRLAAIGIAVLGFADPAAGIIGRRFGRVRLVNGRTLEGTTTFFVVGTVAALAAIKLAPEPLALPRALLVATSAAMTSALVELFSRRVDDNFSVPLSAAAGAALALAALGLPLWV